MPALDKSPHQVFSRSLTQIAICRNMVDDLDRVAGRHHHRKRSFVLRGYTVYLVAAWQQFIRDLGQAGIRFSGEQEGQAEPIIQERLDEFKSTFWGKNFTTSQTVSKAVKIATGVPSVMQRCFWDGYPHKKVKNALADVGRARNQISHEGQTEKPLELNVNFNWMAVLYAIGGIINNVVNEEFQRRYQAEPFMAADPMEAFRQLLAESDSGS